MTLRRWMAVLVVLVAGSVVLPGTASASPSPATIARANELMGMSAEEFVDADKSGDGLELSTDGCSGRYGLTLVYHVDECVQHDFGYRNYGARYGIGLSPTAATKEWIDDRFLEEMMRTCRDDYVPGVGGGPVQECVDEARVAFYGVRTQGDPSFF